MAHELEPLPGAHNETAEFCFQFEGVGVGRSLLPGVLAPWGVGLQLPLQVLRRHTTSSSEGRPWPRSPWWEGCEWGHGPAGGTSSPSSVWGRSSLWVAPRAATLPLPPSQGYAGATSPQSLREKTGVDPGAPCHPGPDAPAVEIAVFIGPAVPSCLSKRNWPLSTLKDTRELSARGWEDWDCLKNVSIQSKIKLIHGP